MHDLLAVVGWLTCVAILVSLFNEMRSPRGLVLSWKTIFLAGYTVFYGTGTALLAAEKYTNPFYIPSGHAIAVMTFWVPTFLVLFLLFYKLGRKWTGLTKVIPTCSLPLSSPLLFISLGICMALGLITTLVPIPDYLGMLMAQFRDGWLAASVGLATFYLLSRKRNPLAMGVFALVLPTVLVLATTAGIGRRPLLNMFLMVGWVGYFYYFRFCPRSVRMTWLIAGGTAAVAALTMYAAFRADVNVRQDRQTVISQRVAQIKRALTNPRIETEAIWSLLATDPSIYTGYLIDQVPDNLPPYPFQGLAYFLANPIPRQFWPGKPSAIGILIQERLGLVFNVGPGIIGHGYYEMLHLGVVWYALFFGVACAAVDTAIRRRADQPLFVIAVGTCLGNVMGLPRGETFLFFLGACATFVAAMGVFVTLRLVAGGVFRAFPPLPHPAAKLGLSPSAQFIEEGPALDHLRESEAQAGGDEVPYGEEPALVDAERPLAQPAA